jgi:elongation factor Ts
MEISPQQVKQLREMTGAGMMDCKKALAESEGSMDKAVEFLRKKGLKDLSKRAERTTSEGIVYSYIHGATESGGGRVGVMVELNCETDFVGRGEEFVGLAKSIAMHIAWASPRYVNREEVPAEVIAKEREIYGSQLKPEQAKVADKILDGKIEKFYEECCLLDQIDVKDASAKKKIGEIVAEFSAKVGEKIVVRRFARFETGKS